MYACIIIFAFIWTHINAYTHVSFFFFLFRLLNPLPTLGGGESSGFISFRFSFLSFFLNIIISYLSRNYFIFRSCSVCFLIYSQPITLFVIFLVAFDGYFTIIIIIIIIIVPSFSFLCYYFKKIVIK